MPPSRKHQKETDLDDSVEEFSSFDISDQESVEKRVILKCGDFYESDDDHAKVNSMSTPDNSSLIFNNRSVEPRSTSTKTSSRLSSDTFETPKTIETRASTMTSSSLFYPKMEPNSQLLFAAATRNSIKLSKSPMKRLSRCSDIDNSFEKEFAPIKTPEPSTINDLFSKLSLDEPAVSFANHIAELQSEVTNYKIQIKLLNSLIREKFSETGVTNQALGEEFERQLLNKINASKYKMQFCALKKEHEENQNMYCNLKKDYDNLLHSNEILNEKESENVNNQHEWSNMVTNALTRLNITFKKAQSFNDSLHSLVNHVEELQSEYEKLQQESENLWKLKSQVQEVKIKLTSYEQLNNEVNKRFSEIKHELDVERVKTKELTKENLALISDLKYFRDREVKHGDLRIKLKEIEQKNSYMIKENNALRQGTAGESEKIIALTTMMSSYHSVILNLLMKVIDPASSGDIIEACENLSPDLPFDQIFKVFSVAHSYEIESITAIIESYGNLSRIKHDYTKSQEELIELKSQISKSNKKIQDLEYINHKETTRVQELEKRNNRLQKYSNYIQNDNDNLKKLRLEDLNNKWKAAEEALSQSKKGAQMKVAELEEEIRLLQSQSK